MRPLPPSPVGRVHRAGPFSHQLPLLACWYNEPLHTYISTITTYLVPNLIPQMSQARRRSCLRIVVFCTMYPHCTKPPIWFGDKGCPLLDAVSSVVNNFLARYELRLRELPFNEVSIFVKHIPGLDKSPSNTVINIISRPGADTGQVPRWDNVVYIIF
jgi:hypothetical protein